MSAICFKWHSGTHPEGQRFKSGPRYKRRSLLDHKHYAYLNKGTGETYYVSTLGDSDELHDDLEENEKYINIPHKNDLDLGRNLVFNFISANLPGQLEQIRGIFHSKGAFARFKDLLESKRQLEVWYEYERKATERRFVIGAKTTISLLRVNDAQRRTYTVPCL